MAVRVLRAAIAELPMFLLCGQAQDLGCRRAYMTPEQL
jgi:hypothetical protein